MNKSLSYVNLSLLFQHFDWDLTHQVLFLYIYFAQQSYELERPALENTHVLVQRTNIFSCKLSVKVSLMLNNPFLVPSLCKLNHISLCFIHVSTKSPAKLLIPFTESSGFFEVIPGTLGRSVNFNITLRFLLRRPVFPDYPFLVNMITLRQILLRFLDV